jgi:hypothetical protein
MIRDKYKYKQMGWRLTAGALGAVLAVVPPSAVAAGGPPLGAAKSFVALGGSSLNNAGPSVFTGDVGVSPGTSITGFPPGTVVGGGIHANDAAAAAAHSDAANAYAFLAGMASSPANNLTGQDLGGMTLATGVYKFNTSAQLTGQLRLDAGGDSNALFVFQIGSTLTTASAASVVVINGGPNYDKANIFWQVGSSATLGSGTSFSGHILASASITVVNGSSMTGNALALNGAVTTDSNTNSTPPAILPPGGSAIDAPLSLTAALSGTAAAPSAELRWNDASDNETDFRVYRREGASPDFALVGSVGTLDSLGTGGLVTYHDPALSVSTTYTYKVTAFAALVGESGYSNEALVDTVSFTPPVVINVLPPLTLTAVLSGSVASPGSILHWNDASANETEFRVFRRDGAGPNYVQVGTVSTADGPGVGGDVTFNDLVLNPSTTFTYRVTAFSPVDGESAPSNETLIDTAALPPLPPARWLDVHLGRGRGGIRDRDLALMDRVYVSGSYVVIDVDSSVPTVLHDADPRVNGVSVQVRAPGNLALLVVPPNDPGWRVLGKGIYQWRSHDGPDAPRMGIRINTRRSAFRFRCYRTDFAAMPINDITATLTMFGAVGSASRPWNEKAVETGTKALFKLPR